MKTNINILKAVKVVELKYIHGIRDRLFK